MIFGYGTVELKLKRGNEMKKKILIVALCLIFYLSIALNIYHLMPPKASESISRGYYLSHDADGSSYGLSITEDHKVIVYDPITNIVLEGKLEFNQKNNDYLITTSSNVFEVVARNDVVFLPIINNGKIISKTFTKIGNASVSYEKDGSTRYNGPE